jgi:hypothetical protein
VFSFFRCFFFFFPSHVLQFFVLCSAIFFFLEISKFNKNLLYIQNGLALASLNTDRIRRRCGIALKLVCAATAVDCEAAAVAVGVVDPIDADDDCADADDDCADACADAGANVCADAGADGCAETGAGSSAGSDTVSSAGSGAVPSAGSGAWGLALGDWAVSTGPRALRFLGCSAMGSVGVSPSLLSMHASRIGLALGLFREIYIY